MYRRKTHWKKTGTANGDPGPAVSGVCAWCGIFDNLGLHARGPLIQKWVHLGTSTNNWVAHGQATAPLTGPCQSCWQITFQF